jgi:hypothetical protein
VANRAQGVLVRTQPSPQILHAVAGSFAFKLFELKEQRLWILDLELVPPVAGNRGGLRQARPLAPSYVDAIGVLSADEKPLEQLPWLVASSTIARLVRGSVLGFVADDAGLDFVTVAAAEAVEAIGDHVEPYLLRWERDSLAIQPYVRDTTFDVLPDLPEELGLIPAINLLPAEPLPGGGYPLFGNVAAEMAEFAPGVAEALGLSMSGERSGSIEQVADGGMKVSCWDR